MRLKSLELHGFKSFPDRTKINFSEGMTVIVGPNGSGKSNISDAIRWVLGDISAKNIRGNKMEDVIFGGTDGRSPMSFAEVSLTIDNSGENHIENDFDEITITRRYYRSGDSEYLINNKVSRLRDITEMFMNTGIGKTGYSIVGQGRVSEIISQKSEERRIIFEEAAGISKYRFKKQEAERRLQATDENIVRINDIVGELESRVGPLEKDAAKAHLYLDLYEQKKTADIAITVYDVDKISESSKSIEEDYRASERELSALDEAIASYDTRIEKLGEIITENKISGDHAAKESLDIISKKHKIESELLVIANDITHLTEISASLDTTVNLLKNTLENKESEKKNSSEKINQNKIKLDESEKKLSEIADNLNSLRGELEAAHNKISSLDEKYKEIVQLHTNSRVSLSAIEETKSSIDLRKKEISNDINKLDIQIADIKKKIESTNLTINQYKSKLDEISKTRADITEKNNDCIIKLNGLRDNYNSIISYISALDQRAITLKRMEDHFEGYVGSVKFIADAKSKGLLTGICGPVSKIIRVDKKYSIAIETSLGNNIQNIVVENEEAAKAGINLLKKENAGRITFYPITSMKASKINVPKYVEESDGFIGIASDLIDFDSKFGNVISSLLGRTLIFDKLNHASTVAKQSGYSLRIVTLDGQIINAGGSFTGGSAKKDSGILTRSIEIDEILKTKKQSEEKSEKLKKEINEINVANSEMTDQLNQLLDEYSMFSALYKSEQTTADFQNNKLSELYESKKSCESKLNQLELQEKDKENSRNRLINDCEKYRQIEEDFTNEITEATNVKDDLDQRVQSLISEKNAAFTTALLDKREYELSIERLSDLTSEIESIKVEISANNEKSKATSLRIQSLENQRAENAEQIEKLTDSLKKAEDDKKTLSDKAIELEKELNDIRTISKEKSRDRENTFMRYTTLKSKIDAITLEKTKLTDKLWDEYELTLSDACKVNYVPVTEETRSKRVSEQQKLRSKIRELGNINIDAIEEYSKVKERYEFLSSQLNDLNKSKKEFTDIITKLESQMCQQFSKTFEEINNNFGQVFSELFGGGTGSLTLTDPENVLTSGIEINVAPPGKIIKNLKLLSGGEQVFVAIGIFFAILKVNPSPFCLLDEIESALDEVNVDRFAEYAKNYSDKTQFIIITHRRGTMEQADTLYGVTMQERGISKMLSININEVEQKLGIKL
jgi:chromosome segregation protein